MKSLSQRISENEKAAHKTKLGRNLTVFLALKDEIKGAVSDGWPTTAIWETLHQEGKIKFSYQSFRKLVVKFIIKNQDVQKETDINRTPSPAIKTKEKKSDGFSFQPHANKKDLI